ncbi:MAG: DNA polymerase III subunit delta [Acidimicrobiia bacterium]|nr:DNA polymerase III subunit delta [Acidimicrobiia bacterium]
MSTAEAIFPVYLVRGDDPTVSADEVKALVAELVGASDPAFVVEELSGDEYSPAALVEAAQTPPFFGDRRVVVARDVSRFTTAEVAPLLSYLADPLPTSTLVLVAAGGKLPRSLVDAVRKAGHVVETSVPAGRGRSTWISARLKEGPVRLDAQATALVTAHLGDDVGRLGSLLTLLAAVHGAGARLGADEITPFLGQAGPVAPWDLTDAIDSGDIAAALGHLHRLVGAGGRHPLVVAATLHNHYARMLRLDGAGVADEKAAAAVLGMKGSTFPAKKALTQTRRLGHQGVDRAITLLADADLALKGAVDWPPEAVLEVLVARLTRLTPRPAGTGRR